jgi:hypothetical protein
MSLHARKSCVLGIIKEPVAIENIEKILSSEDLLKVGLKPQPPLKEQVKQSQYWFWASWISCSTTAK